MLPFEMGLFKKRERKPETLKQITDRVFKENGGYGPPPGPHEVLWPDPIVIRKLAKEVKRAMDRGLLIEEPKSGDSSTSN